MRAAVLAAGLASAGPGRPIAAQSPVQAQVMGQAVIALTHAEPVPGGDGLTELRVVQPVVMLRADGPRRIGFLATLNLEGATIAEGELTPGAWGEGFVDRRHPHTYAHELMLTAGDLLGAADGVTRLSLAAGKGFAPFGTDDPMTRPPLRYPVNHHLAQILERAVAIAAVAHGPFTGEIGLFNGDEPERPGQWPRVGAVRRLLGAAADGRAGDRRRAPGVPRPRALAGAPAGGGDRPVEVEPLGALGASARRPPGATAWWNGPGPRRRTVSSSSPACWPKVHGGRAATVSTIDSSGPSGRRSSGSRASGSCGRTTRTRSSATTRWTIHTAGILGVRNSSAGRSACGHCSRSRTDGSARSAAGSSTSSRCTAGTTSGAAPWACVSRSAAGPIGWDATARR